MNGVRRWWKLYVLWQASKVKMVEDTNTSQNEIMIMKIPWARKVLCSVRLSSLITSSAICNETFIGLKIALLIKVT